ncbi:hypothetical protein AZI86_17645 [Bdellovibrio bacteriovorus]|uniref:Secreted protein n=1 Tax=Bdellovibrio bacteriovorus TaxID=959 RepID=A0A150WFE8_BDEBC|nr:hypothetical protein [Bdellovibrio bacteriovorus]KYG61531.1 hypothetical protein AZI86_17645 [Bdellovibrio bacteriovorus]
MKALVFIAGLLIAGSASAACTEGNIALIVKHNVTTDKDITEVRVCKNGTFMTPAEKAAYIYNPRTTCTEGSKAIFVKQLPGQDRETSEVRVCKNGTFMTAAEKAAYVRNPKSTCVEGAYSVARADSYFRNLSEEQADKSITVVCKSNKWVPVRGL